MPLGSDVTAFYGSILAGQAPSTTYDSPYNTLIHTGWPPTPISNVNAQALQAATHPGQYRLAVLCERRRRHDVLRANRRTTPSRHHRPPATRCASEATQKLKSRGGFATLGSVTFFGGAFVNRRKMVASHLCQKLHIKSNLSIPTNTWLRVRQSLPGVRISTTSSHVVSVRARLVQTRARSLRHWWRQRLMKASASRRRVIRYSLVGINLGHLGRRDGAVGARFA